LKKLNRKGYITVEILIASIIAVVIAVFLIELTVKLVSKTDDVYVDTILTTDKVLITNQIMDDISSYGIYHVNYMRSDNKIIGLIFTFSNGINKKLYLIDMDTSDKVKHSLIYCKIDSESDDGECAQEENYIKNFNIAFSQIEYNISDSDYIGINLTLKTIYSDKNYGFSIAVPKTTQYNVVTIKYNDNLNSATVLEKEYKLNKENDGKYYLWDGIDELDENISDYYIIDGDGYCTNDVNIDVAQNSFQISGANNTICTIGVCPIGQESQRECQSR